MPKALDVLSLAARSTWYWLLLILLGMALEGIALYYQYVLDYWPCVLCIHVRIWILGMILAAIAGLVLRNSRSLCALSHLLVASSAAGLLERSWQLLGTERGTLAGSCTMDSGLPAWFALDRWFPALFKAWEPCGYTPELLFGVTMAEALLLMSAGLLLISILLGILCLRRF